MALPRKLTVKNLLTLDYAEINNIDASQIVQLRKAVKVLADAGNKRLKRFEEKGEESPAFQYVKGGKRSKGNFTTKGKDLNQLKAEFQRAKTFMTSKTGSLTGWKKVKEETIDKLKAESNIELSPEQFDVFWRSYTELTRTDAGKKIAKQYKYQVLEEISEIQKPGMSVSDIVGNLQSKITELYESAKEEENAQKVKRGKYTDIPGI